MVHIKLFKYNDGDAIINGFARCVDIHTLFNAEHLRIFPEGNIELSNRVSLDYDVSIPLRIVISSFTYREFYAGDGKTIIVFDVW